ncbi:hypothetical protein D770_23425 [Flammeovirgaceae bacterium 311]|nr:hypothetical protein D770_23425 [Flammeovirgaceae bacterium 311]
MEFLNTGISFLTDKTRNISSKAIFIILAIAFLVMLDNTLSFTYFYNVSQKNSQIIQISEILKDSTLSDYEIKKLLNLRRDIIEHATIKDKAYGYLTNLNFESSKEAISEDAKVINMTRNQTMHFLTSSWWLIFILVVGFITHIYEMLFKRTDVTGSSLGLLAGSIAFYLFALLLSKMLSYIPLINGDPLYNYVLNIILSGLIPLMFMLASKKKNKKLSPTTE